jgi:hypothetical protein
MKRFHNEQNAPSGIYVSPSHLDVRLVDRGDERLHGKDDATYYRVPFSLLIVAGPILGAIFAMAFPVVVFYALVSGIVERLASPRKLLPDTCDAGQSVREGVYVGVTHLGARYVSAPNEALEGEPGQRFVRVPTALMLLASPFVGAAYVVAFPFIAAMALVGMLAHVVMDAARNAWEEHAHLADLRWSPAAAYLVPESKDTPNADATQTPAPQAELDPTLAALNDEISARRAEETLDSTTAASQEGTK